LCRGFLQITRTTPSRRIILQSSHRFFTDEDTFTGNHLLHGKLKIIR
jgi:hypothetical protein